MFDLILARARIGLLPGDSSQDTIITQCLNTAMAWAETYCDRQFAKKTETVQAPLFDANVLQLRRYPLESVASIAGDNAHALPGFKLRPTAGQVLFLGRVTQEELTVTFTGGYSPTDLPTDLELALWLLFDVAYQKLSAVYDKTAGGAIKSIMSSGTSIAYFAAGESGTGGPGTGIGLDDPTVTRILDLYTLRKA